VNNSLRLPIPNPISIRESTSNGVNTLTRYGNKITLSEFSSAISYSSRISSQSKVSSMTAELVLAEVGNSPVVCMEIQKEKRKVVARTYRSKRERYSNRDTLIKHILRLMLL
jgi:hypothetical protein